MENQAYIAGFQESVRKDYPRFSSESMGLSFAIQMGVGVTQPTLRTFWRMASFDSKWVLTLTQDFLTLETTAYIHRDDFVKRWAAIIDAFQRSFTDITVVRYGLRYVNRIDDPALMDRIKELVNPAALGIISQLPGAERAEVSMSEAVFSVPEGKMRVKWGILPANAMHDPSIQPSTKRSWILDYDIFQESSPSPLELEAVKDVAPRFAERGYAMFRWMVEDAFLEAFGGKS
jgi:uncharacterized protein (TIGR04255 family)